MPVAPYNYVTLGQARQELANRLYDSAQVFWSAAELNNYIVESLRTWNALTSYWRDDFIFSPLVGTRWFDIPFLGNSLRSYNASDQDIYVSMQYSLLEPATGIDPWAGSAQFTADDFLNAVQRRLDEVMSTTACTVAVVSTPAVAGRITLPDNVIDIRRMAYFPAVGSPSKVWPDDTWSEMAFNPTYIQAPAGTPSMYLQTTQPPISFDTDKPPGSAGSYELLTINSGPMLQITIGSKLKIPDDWSHIVKWGALADLLSRESNAKDAIRAQYCEGRYRMGLKLLDGASALLALRVDNVPVWIDSVYAADSFQTAWQTLPLGKPSAVYYAGLNLIALSPVPDAGPYSITATVVENAPIPVFSADTVQMGRDDYDAMLDYAQHLASFKMGGAEFLATMPLFQRFMAQAAIYNRKLDQIAEFTKPLYALASREKDMNPITTPEATNAS